MADDVLLAVIVVTIKKPVRGVRQVLETDTLKVFHNTLPVRRYFAPVKDGHGMVVAVEGGVEATMSDFAFAFDLIDLDILLLRSGNEQIIDGQKIVGTPAL